MKQNNQEGGEQKEKAGIKKTQKEGEKEKRENAQVKRDACSDEAARASADNTKLNPDLKVGVFLLF